MSHTFSPEGDRRAEVLALLASVGCAVMMVIVFFPAEGRVLAPLHTAFGALLGQIAFVLPLGLALGAGLGFTRRVRQDAVVPRKRLIGLGLITIALFPADQLLGQSTGLVGDWFTQWLVAMLGWPLTVAMTLVLLGVGTVLTFELWRRPLAAR